MDEKSVPARRAVLDSLPVCVIDPFNKWKLLSIPEKVLLGRIEWVWSSKGVSMKNASNATEASFTIRSLEPDMQSMPPHLWYTEPYVFLYVVSLAALGEKSNEDTWKALGSFLANCRESEAEYLVVYPAEDLETKRYARVIEELKMEVNVTIRVRERTIRVVPRATQADVAQVSSLNVTFPYRELVLRLRECCREAVEARVQQYEEEVGRIYAGRQTDSWEFTSYFAIKEGMAFVFMQICRRDLSLQMYDELITVPFSFEVFCDPSEPNDAALGLTDPVASSFLSRLLDGTVSELEFRTYLFSRQLSLLLYDRKYPELADRGLKFITLIMRRIVEESSRLNAAGPSLPLLFKDAWVFSASRSLSDVLAPAIPSPAATPSTLSAQLATARERHMARLLAGYHVHALKAFASLCSYVLPGDRWPVAPHGSSVAQGQQHDVDNLSNDVLRNALKSKGKAEELYAEIAYNAASLYEMGARERGAAALDGDTGVIRLRNGSFEDAERLLSAQCSLYTDDHGWDQLHHRRRIELAKAQKKLDHVKDYLISCLTLLYMTRTGRQLKYREEDGGDDSTLNMIDARLWAHEAADAASRLPRVMKYKADRLLVIRVKPNPQPWCEGESGDCTVIIESDIPATLQFDSVRLDLRVVGAELGSSDDSRTNGEGGGEAKTSSSGTVHLDSRAGVSVSRGTTNVVVSTQQVPHSGRYIITLVTLFMGRLKLVQTTGELNSSPTVVTMGTKKPLSVSSIPVELGCFPLMYSDAKASGVELVIAGPKSLLFAPGIHQNVRVRIRGGKNGIAKGAQIRVQVCHAGERDEASRSVPLSFLRICPSGLCLDPLESEVVDTEHKVIEDEGCAHTSLDSNHYEKVLITAIPANSERFLNLVLEAKEAGVDKCACTLKVSLIHFESRGDGGRQLKSEAEDVLRFRVPVTTLASINFDRQTPSGSGSTYGHEAKGGIVRVLIQAKVAEITLYSCIFKPPFWMEIGDVSPPHTVLLPYRLEEDSVFSLAWEVSTNSDYCRRQDRTSLNAISKRVLSDESSSVGFVVESRDERSLGECERDSKSLKLDNSEKRSQVKAHTLAVKNDADSSFSVPDIKSVDTQACSPEKSGSDSLLSKNQGTERIRSMSEIGLLSIEVAVGQDQSRTVLERVIHTENLKVAETCYQIYRECKAVAVAGEPTPLSFTVVRQEKPEVGMGELVRLEYEIVFNDMEWVVMGARRGRIRCADGSGNIQVDVLPLVPGRLRLPTLKLFNAAGNPIDVSLIRTWHEDLEVLVVSEGSVSSMCISSRIPAMALQEYTKITATATPLRTFQNLNVEKDNVGPSFAHVPSLPAVLTSDSFFET